VTLPASIAAGIAVDVVVVVMVTSGVASPDNAAGLAENSRIVVPGVGGWANTGAGAVRTMIAETISIAGTNFISERLLNLL
jgi:hypothetical protein